MNDQLSQCQNKLIVCHSKGNNQSVKVTDCHVRNMLLYKHENCNRQKDNHLAICSFIMRKHKEILVQLFEVYNSNM